MSVSRKLINNNELIIWFFYVIMFIQTKMRLCWHNNIILVYKNGRCLVLNKSNLSRKNSIKTLITFAKYKNSPVLVLIWFATAAPYVYLLLDNNTIHP